jgi:hypothetical protein
MKGRSGFYIPPVPRHPADGATPNIFGHIEKFATQAEARRLCKSESIAWLRASDAGSLLKRIFSKSSSSSSALGVGCFHSRLSFRRRASRCNRPKIHPRFPQAIGVSLNVDLPSKPSSYDGTRFHSGH